MSPATKPLSYSLPTTWAKHLRHLVVGAELDHLDRFLDHNGVPGGAIVDLARAHDLFGAVLVFHADVALDDELPVRALHVRAGHPAPVLPTDQQSDGLRRKNRPEPVFSISYAGAWSGSGSDRYPNQVDHVWFKE